VLLAAAGRSGLTALVRGSAWRRSRLLILCYHGVSLGDEHEAAPELYMTAGLLRRRLAHLRDRRCRVLPLGEALERLWAGTLPPRSVALTFDDGTRDFAECVVPLLREFGVPASVYLSTYYCGRGQPTFDPALRYLLWRGRATGADVRDLAGARAALPLATAEARQAAWDAVYGRTREDRLGADAKDALLRRLAGRVGVDYDGFVASGMFQVMSPAQVGALPRDLVDVQLHTHRHWMPHERALFLREIADNRERLTALGFPGGEHFCYPSGEYRADAAEWLLELGVRSATTCVPGVAGPDTDPMLLPRFVDTSAYLLIATEELAFSSLVDFSN
jgi:peptidoglycan/xylan/chitin deacetylase (PgdA/CDA1 family)